MFKAVKATIGAVAMAAMMSAGSLVAVPSAQADAGFYGAQVHQVGGKNNKGRNWNRGWNNRPHYNYNYNRYRYNNYNRGWNNNWVGPAIGLGAGVIIGSMLAAPRYAPAPRAYYGGNRQAYCAQKYRSYNPRTGTYTGYDGRQHYCRIP